MTIKRAIVGSPVKFTWISSGDTPNPITHSLFSGSETLINSVAATSSGNGHYYAVVTLPDTPGFYVGEWRATMSGNVYKNRDRIQAVLLEVD